MTTQNAVITADIALDFTKPEAELTQALINQVPDLISQTVDGVIYNILLEHRSAEGVGRTRNYSGVPNKTTTESLEYVIKGHPEGYPHGPWPFATGLPEGGSCVRITLIPSPVV